MTFSKRIFIGIACLFSSVSAFADWNLVPDSSSLSFVSIKKDTIAEVHKFSNISGSIMDTGAFSFTVDLSSVDTGIEIRNERMKEHLFTVTTFPNSTASGTIAPADIKKLEVGVPVAMTVDLSINLHGLVVKKPAALRVVKLSRKRLLVVSSAPLIINASDFGLSAGVAKLKELAVLPSIAESVPVTVNLLFSKK